MTSVYKPWMIAALAGAVLCLQGAESANASAGTSAGWLFATADTARGHALHGATVTLSGDAGAVFANPAGLAGLAGFSGLFSHQTGLALDGTEILTVAFPLQGVGGAGATLAYHGYQPLDDAGEGIPAIDVNEKMAILSFGRAEPSLLEGLAYGVNLKVLQAVLGEYAALAWAADVGLQWAPFPETAVGLAVKHLGTGLQFISEESPLPTALTLGGRYVLLSGSEARAFVAADAEYTLEGDTLLHAGGELDYLGIFFLRAGYSLGVARTLGAAFGLGIYPKFGAYTVRLDYAYRVNAWSNDSFEGTQLITVGLMF